MMIESKNYKGIEYIQLNELPQTQKEQLLNTINQDLFIKIMVDGKIITSCLQYKDYALWFKTVYQAKPALVQEAEKAEGVRFKADLAFK